MTKNYIHHSKQKKKAIKRRSETKKSTNNASLDKSSLTLLKVFICVFAVVVMLIIKLMLPDTMATMKSSIRSWVSGNVDYKAAMSTLGEAMMGKKSVFTALPEAYSYAFGIIEEDYVPVADLSGETYKDLSEKPNNEGSIISDNVLNNNSDNNSTTEKNENSVVDAFLEKQSAFSEYELPEKVSYDMPEITNKFVLPANGPVTSEFGYRNHPVESKVLFHYGTDIGASYGDDISSIDDGTVIAVGESVSYGKFVMIKHENDIISQYSHCSEILVKDGSEVKKGEAIAKVGDTGNATSACLHFELQIDGMYVNPEYYLKWN